MSAQATIFSMKCFKDRGTHTTQCTGCVIYEYTPWNGCLCTCLDEICIYARLLQIRGEKKKKGRIKNKGHEISSSPYLRLH